RLGQVGRARSPQLGHGVTSGCRVIALGCAGARRVVASSGRSVCADSTTGRRGESAAHRKESFAWRVPLRPRRRYHRASTAGDAVGPARRRRARQRRTAVSDFRRYLEALEKAGQLVRVTKEVSPEFEVAAYVRKSSDANGPAFVFERVTGHPG